MEKHAAAGSKGNKLNGLNGAKQAAVAGLSQAITTILVWGLNTYVHAAIPDYVQGAFTAVISVLVVYLNPPPLKPTA